MKSRSTTITAAVLLAALSGQCPSLAGPATLQQSQHQTEVLEQLKKAIAAEVTDEGKFRRITAVMKDEPDVGLRSKVLETAIQIRGPVLESFLTELLKIEEDAGLRGQAATALGRTGSEKCLSALAETAKSDRTTAVQIGDIGGQSSARRAATFAIAALAARFPKLADDAAAKLRALPVVDDPKDNEGLADARTQALYQITRDAALLKPFYERLGSKTVEDRVRGVVAFQFLKLKLAPAELVAALHDSSGDVRSWAALVLGEIGDPKTGETLMAVAGDAKESSGVRCNAIYSLGRMKAPAATELLEKLLKDSEPSIATNAAIALYRITGKKVKEFPEGYRVD